ncbi:short-chain fatty acyl-CoA regulator family protein [Magnetospirillum fulvum]|uniref:XRE family transcriptional regulator n=1 Tax=Magnetospirillum fulvum MGU-K5 TaxID=1316936 RepID=S9SCI9_MAGFU|nr:short-chain fatty acyl-CoA regulator family protein [Magnetospirillum fulvum]EPY01798.1 XRE family transcriptional regulator [Magnetospirillum fulvum MGU-K5]
MRKAYMGARLQRLREERGMTQATLARTLGLSPSYLNQLERNQRPLTVPVLLKINATLGIDVQLFSEDEEARLIADLREALADSGTGETIPLGDIKSLATGLPTIGRALVALHQRGRATDDRLVALAASLGAPADQLTATARPAMPYEAVRDYFYDRHNHVAELDEAAEQLVEACGLSIGAMDEGLERLLFDRHRVRTQIPTDGDLAPGEHRRFDSDQRILRLARSLHPGQRAFQMATQLAFLEQAELIDRLTDSPRLSGSESRSLARIGLANYYAGAVLLPYRDFLATAETLRYDIDLLGERFGVGFETVCHRLSTLQRPNARGVPFFFVRVDRAGNISKRQSATDFHFSRVGGTCPLWNVYEAFASPDRVLTQLAQMPDGRTYLWIARTVARNAGGYGRPGKSFAIGLGCDLRHAGRLVYARGLDLADPAAAIPIGAGCKVCERPSCPQRAFPPIGRTLLVDERRSQFEPYPAA